MSHTDVSVRIRNWCCTTAERGDVVQAAILAPFTVLLFLGLLQATLYYHARSIASAAAEEALRQTSVQYGSAPAGIAAGEAFIAAEDPFWLQGPVVVANRTPTIAVVDVAGKPPSLVPMLPLAIHVHMEQPVERITIPGVPS